MTGLAALAAWIAALPLWGAAPRPPEFATAIAAIALEQAPDAPEQLAANLDLIAAHESGYHTKASGDAGRSLGAWQTPAARTPAGIAGQARLAARMLSEAALACPAHPLWAYASGKCRPSYAAREMEAGVARALAFAREAAAARARADGLRSEP